MPPRETHQPSRSKDESAQRSAPRINRADKATEPATGTSGRMPRRPKSASPDMVPSPSAVISRRAADRLRSGHVWVYRSDVEQLVPAPDLGGNDLRLMAVVDERGLRLGTALYS